MTKEVLAWDSIVDLMEGLDISVDWYLSVSKPGPERSEGAIITDQPVQVN